MSRTSPEVALAAADCACAGATGAALAGGAASADGPEAGVNVNASKPGPPRMAVMDGRAVSTPADAGCGVGAVAAAAAGSTNITASRNSPNDTTPSPFLSNFVSSAVSSAGSSGTPSLSNARPSSDLLSLPLPFVSTALNTRSTAARPDPSSSFAMRAIKLATATRPVSAAEVGAGVGTAGGNTGAATAVGSLDSGAGVTGMSAAFNTSCSSTVSLTTPVRALSKCENSKSTSLSSRR